MKSKFIILILSLIPLFAFSQDEDETITGFYFGPKGGLSLGNQNWNGFERGVMINWHGALFMESLDPELRGSLFMQLGYHSRGSGLRLVNLTQGLNLNQAIVWNNIGLTLGAKKRLITESLGTPYYFVGIRGEYNLKNNIAEVQERFSAGAASLFYPFEIYNRKFVYGLSFGGGYEFYGSEFIQPAVEVTVSPDLSFQYVSPEIGNVINPFDGRAVTLNERNIRNITLEVSLIIKFKREVILLDR